MKVCIVRDNKTGEVVTCNRYRPFSDNPSRARLFKRVSDAKCSLGYLTGRYGRAAFRDRKDNLEVVSVDLTQALQRLEVVSNLIGKMVESNKGHLYVVVGSGAKNVYFLQDAFIEDSMLDRFGISRAIITWSSIRNGEWKIRE